MTINVLSDLHCRNKALPPSFNIDDLEKSDVLVLAGDIGTYLNRDKIVNKFFDLVGKKYDELFYVWGNHDYYVTDKFWSRKHPDVDHTPKFTDNYVKIYKDVAFICTTLWSPITHNEMIASAMNDYVWIRGFTTVKGTELFWKNYQWLKDQIELCKPRSRKIVVITHHLPIPETIDHQYAGNPINEAFCVLNYDINEEIRKLGVDVWIHGHSHNFYDEVINGTRYVRNPYGYEWTTHSYDGSKESTGFKMNHIIEV